MEVACGYTKHEETTEKRHDERQFERAHLLFCISSRVKSTLRCRLMKSMDFMFHLKKSKNERRRGEKYLYLNQKINMALESEMFYMFYILMITPLISFSTLGRSPNNAMRIRNEMRKGRRGQVYFWIFPGPSLYFYAYKKFLQKEEMSQTTYS